MVLLIEIKKRLFNVSIGLRKDKLNKKKYGLIIDFKASNCLKVCDRVNSFKM